MEVISQTAQTFIPPYIAPVTDYIAKRKRKNPLYEPSTDLTAAAWKTSAFNVATYLLKVGFCMATIVASAASLVPAFFGGLLTSDGVVQEAVKPLAKYLWAGAFLTAPVAVSEGVLLARRELSFLAAIYVISTALLPAALLHVKHIGGNVVQVWSCFAFFQLFRATCFTGRIWSGSVLNGIRGLIPGSAREDSKKVKKA